MTPTLIGRFQTRLLVNIAIALPILLASQSFPIIFIMIPVDFLWDYFYDYLQHKRWDADWPLVFVFIGGVLEGVSIYVVIDMLTNINTNRFILIYTVIWLITFISQIGLLNLLFPYRRFKGGRFL